ncbi:maintenance of telomere capping protein 1 [Pisolithus thermaeus]|nr:maintenance of telomere capping protein 1 [Pisolithus croceorrhizus]KAI6158719.1 maintenance of telomere capping protein 1 [Pisolithus thermaeus]
MVSKAKSKQEEALQFLDDLDSLNPASVAPPTSKGTQRDGDPADVLAFIDEITQKSSGPTRIPAPLAERPISRAGTPSLRKSTERVKVGIHPISSSSSLSGKSESTSPAPSAPSKSEVPDTATPGPSGRWGWSNVWSSASAAYQQAKSVVDEQVKSLPKNDQVSKWSEGVLEYAKNAQLDKLSQDFKRVGLSTLNEILNAVAPPISEHEVIQVWLSHDMKGYDGVEGLVYKALTRVMEQVEGGDLIVNRGNESRPKDASDSRDINAVEGYEAALKLAQANLDQLIKDGSKLERKGSSAENPVTYSTVYLRIQPFTTVLTLPQITSDTTSEASYLQFVLHFSDPDHNLVHTTVTQAVPSSWLDLWDQYDWVEDSVAESLRVAVEVLGQDYIVARMGWAKRENQQKE